MKRKDSELQTDFEGSVIPFIDLKRQYTKIKDEILSATKRVYENGFFVLGSEVSAFEEEFARYCGAKYGVGVGSGTDALALALKAAGIGEGDEVITVAHSFIASALAISFTGAKPVFVDIDPDTYTIDPNAVEDYLKKRFKGRGPRKKVKDPKNQNSEPLNLPPLSFRHGPKPKAILPVHLYGHPADMDAIRSLAARYDLLVIEDACQAHGAEYKGRRA